jgi:hypothetical protein
MSSDKDSSLGLFFDQSNRVFLVTFSGAFTRTATTNLNKAAKAVVERYGPVAVILDFSDVTDFAIQLRDWPELGNSRRAIRGKPRMLVAPQTESFSILRLHGTHHEGAGEDTNVVGTRADAYRGLGLTEPKFEPLDLP